LIKREAKRLLHKSVSELRALQESSFELDRSQNQAQFMQSMIEQSPIVPNEKKTNRKAHTRTTTGLLSYTHHQNNQQSWDMNRAKLGNMN